MYEVTLDTDWGAKGAQLTGAQVQSFIKKQFRELIEKDKTLAEKDKALQDSVNQLDAKMTEQKPQINASTDGCFVAYHRQSDNWPCAVPYWEWPDIEKSGEVADGVLVLIDGRPPIIVAPTEKQLYWSKYAYGIDMRLGEDCKLAYADFTGETRTAAIMSRKEKLFGTDETEAINFAPSWCFDYGRSYTYHDTNTSKTNSIGIEKNLWWLPSTAELIVMWKHKHAINLCLSVIKDADLLADDWYWSSTEMSSAAAWRLNMQTGQFDGANNKTSFFHRARPIASFYDPHMSYTALSTALHEEPTDSRFVRLGNCYVYLANELESPIAMKCPLSEEKIQAELIGYHYTDKQVALITNNYELSQNESFDIDLKSELKLQFTLLRRCQSNALIVSRNAFLRKLPIA